MRKFFPILFFAIISTIFFAPFIFKNQIPAPSDTIVGLYHPFRDLYNDEYPNGIPYKNFLITDPIRQQIPWRILAIDTMKEFNLPLWNPYNFAGTPLLANFQTGAFYPLNFLIIVFPFQFAWGILILLQTFLMGAFLYLYLRNLEINKYSSILGGFIFSFSGFSIAWLEWGTIVHTGLWLPLILLSTDKIFRYFYVYKLNIKYQTLPIGRQDSKIYIKNNKLLVWCIIFIFSLASSMFAGHLQTFFYLLLVSAAYVLARWVQFGKHKKPFALFAFCFLLFAVITIVQWLPTHQFILNSARSIDQDWQIAGWFIPWQNLIQFIAPDFFGNPATLNYWGVWNYAEFVGYIGIFPLIMALFALFYRHDKKTFFFGSIFFLSLIFALPTFLAKAPFIFKVPYISTAQPTRLLFLTDFSLAVLAGFGFDKLTKKYKSSQIIPPVLFLALVFSALWFFVTYYSSNLSQISSVDLMVAKRNLILPTLIFAASVFLIGLWRLYSKTRNVTGIILLFLALTVFDLLRFGLKFTPFTSKDYFFPQSRAIEYLQKNAEHARIMSVDDRLLPPNFSAIYRLQDIGGYDPLYLKRYAEFASVIDRNKPNIAPPFGYNRIITPKNFDSKLVDMMGVRYILSLNDLESEKLNKVFTEGQTKIYENADAYDRVFLVKEVVGVSDKNEAIEKIFDKKVNLRITAIVEGWDNSESNFASGSARLAEYQENKIVVETSASDTSFLILTDTFYPTWKAIIDNKESKIYRTNYNFRGVIIPKGEHRVVFENSLL